MIYIYICPKKGIYPTLLLEGDGIGTNKPTRIGKGIWILRGIESFPQATSGLLLGRLLYTNVGPRNTEYLPGLEMILILCSW